MSQEKQRNVPMETLPTAGSCPSMQYFIRRIQWISKWFFGKSYRKIEGYGRGNWKLWQTLVLKWILRTKVCRTNRYEKDNPESRSLCFNWDDRFVELRTRSFPTDWNITFDFSSSISGTFSLMAWYNFWAVNCIITESSLSLNVLKPEVSIVNVNIKICCNYKVEA